MAASLHDGPLEADPVAAAGASAARRTPARTAGGENPAVHTLNVQPARSPSRRYLHLDIVAAVVALLVAEWMAAIVVLPLLADSSWMSAIGSEAIVVLTAILGSLFLPRALDPRVTAASTVDGLLLAWPMLLTSVYYLVLVWNAVPQHVVAGPLGMAFAVGTAEELLFRVVLLGWLMGRLDPTRAVAVSAVIFGAAHMMGHGEPLSLLSFVAVVPQTAMGFVFGGVYARTGDPVPCIITHAMWDLPWFLLDGSQVSGGAPGTSLPTIVALLPWMAFMIYGMWLVRFHAPVVHTKAPAAAATGAL